jgi:hypothetical protein
MKKTVDFDAARTARAEKNGEVPTAVLSGVTFEFPAEMPFAIVEDTRRLVEAQENNDGFAVSEIIAGIAKSLFGERFDEFMGLGPSMMDMQELLSNVMQLYGIDSGESQASEG